MLGLAGGAQARCARRLRAAAAQGRRAALGSLAAARATSAQRLRLEGLCKIAPLNIALDEASHRYAANGVACVSVTRLVDSIFEPFDADETIAKYYSKWQRDPRSKYYGQSEAQILAAWAANGAKSRELGSALHAGIEDFFRTGSRSWLDAQAGGVLAGEALQFSKLVAAEGDTLLAEPVAVEFRMADPELGVAGTVDFIGLDHTKEQPGPDGVYSLRLLDWKRTKDKISPTATSVRCARPPFNDVPDTAYARYSLQLNLYAMLLERNYNNVRVSSSSIVQLSPQSDAPQIVQVSRDDETVARLMEHYYANEHTFFS
jgi:hypothetical protein